VRTGKSVTERPISAIRPKREAAGGPTRQGEELQPCLHGRVRQFEGYILAPVADEFASFFLYLRR
jgi:hypothetical protein